MRMLIVEDDADISELLCKQFKAHGFAIDATASGKEGSYLARIHDYDIVLLDYNLPEKNGLEICLDIRSNGKTMPILMLSVRNDVTDKVELLQSGVDDYVTKPFSFDEIKARVDALLRRPKNIVSDIIVRSDITIDTRRQVVFRGEQEILLTRKEFSLLEYLARHEGMVVSRGMIMEHVWDMESDPFSNTIEAHIFNIRKKIAQGKAPIIHTISGRGYKFEIV